MMVGVAISDIEVPNCHLEAWVFAVTPFVEFAAQAVAVNIMAQLHRNLVVDERHHVNKLFVIACGKRFLHHVDAVDDVVPLSSRHFLIVRRLELEQDVLVFVRDTVCIDWMEF